MDLSKISTNKASFFNIYSYLWHRKTAPLHFRGIFTLAKPKTEIKKTIDKR